MTHHLTIKEARGCIAEQEESLAKGAGAGLQPYNQSSSLSLGRDYVHLSDSLFIFIYF